MSSSNQVVEKTKEVVSKGTEGILIAGPKPINLVVKDFNLKDITLENDIVNGLWLPIRKQVRLTENIDIVMCTNKCTFTKVDKDGNIEMRERKNGEPRPVLIPAIRFHFINSVVYNEFMEEPESVYQYLTLRSGVDEDIRKVQNDATKVHMRYIDKKKFKEIQNKQLKEASRAAKRVKSGKKPKIVLKEMVREMKIPTEDKAKEMTEMAIKVFRQKLRSYIEVMNENKVAAGFTPKLHPTITISRA